MRTQAACFAVCCGLLARGSASADPREDSLRYNSRCIRAHASAHDYIPSTAQIAALDAGALDPKEVLSDLISFVEESLADFQSSVRLVTSNPKIRGVDSESKREFVASLRKDAAKCRCLLRELHSIELMDLTVPGAHAIKGKTRICPHEANGRLNVQQFKKLR